MFKLRQSKKRLHLTLKDKKCETKSCWTLMRKVLYTLLRDQGFVKSGYLVIIIFYERI